MAQQSTITRLLVANRGEITRRIFATCRRMGIATAAVYSEADRSAPFVREADSAAALTGNSPAETYLDIEAVVAAARRLGADAVHPGYGFLAENASFARAVEEAGLIWIGPPATAIEVMGSKLASKRLMEAAGVPTLAGFDLTGSDPAEAAELATRIGYPVLVKASAGGGGKGMRIVAEPEELDEAIEAARREAGAAFGDDTLFLEKYLEAPRHIEIQIFADTAGETVSLFERECSIQRRHQKIIEEAPSPVIDEATRTRMGEAAVAAARAVDYVGAGTVEFLYQEGEFYFLEMNTRLQVEHPVTEMVTGLDLVRLQLTVAMGEPLPEAALRPSLVGHAIEARLYAEDPSAGFLPVTGTLDRFEVPAAEGLRVDSGVESGSEISVYYDPMLAKVVAWAPTRAEAAILLARSLERAAVHGSVTNRDLLVRILRHPEFLAGEIDTHFLERHEPSALSAPLVDADGERRAAVAAALAAQVRHRHQARALGTLPSGWRNVPSQPQRIDFAGSHGEIEVGYSFDRSGRLTVDGYDNARLLEASEDRVGLELEGLLGWYRVHQSGDTIYVDGPEGPVQLTEKPRFPDTEHEEDPGSLHAPMPGKVIRVTVEEGDTVEEGQVLVVLEAMKMEHSLRAPHGGVVTAIHAGAGDQVAAEAVLVVVGES
ncbi:MAG TPA: biotin carboxylase N-terminal domain-containing protein [Acidimicrobiia bacterium]|nr:biotin carboxylase N-terminal domain-containing protein [Acidimicrobiia bacterium]